MTIAPVQQYLVSARHPYTGLTYDYAENHLERFTMLNYHYFSSSCVTWPLRFVSLLHF